MCWCSDIQTELIFIHTLIFVSSLLFSFLFLFDCSVSSIHSSAQWILSVMCHRPPHVLSSCSIFSCKQTTSTSRLWSGLFQHLWSESLISEWLQPAAISDGILKQLKTIKLLWLSLRPVKLRVVRLHKWPFLSTSRFLCVLPHQVKVFWV